MNGRQRECSKAGDRERDQGDRGGAAAPARGEAALAKLDGGSTPRRGRNTSTTTRRRASSGNGRRRRGGRGAQALKLITDNPGITIPDLAQRMKIAPNYLYRVVPQLQKDGKVKKNGKGWIVA